MLTKRLSSPKQRMICSVFLSLLLIAAATWYVQAKVPEDVQLALAMDIPIVESAHPYPPNFNDFWTLEVAGAEAVRIHFSRIELEENADYLIISDPSECRTQVITGSYPDGLWTDPVPGEFVRISLVTDGTVARWGFAVDQKEAVAYPSLVRSAHPYHNWTDQSVTVFGSSPGVAVRVHFSRIDLEENVDWLILRDIEGIPYQYITGSHPEGLWSIGIPGIGVEVQLVTDGTVEDWGFNIDGVESTVSDVPIPFPEFPTVVESPHPVGGTGLTWTITNPNPLAPSTKVHFSRIHLAHPDYQASDVLQLLDGEDRVMQQWSGGQDTYDVWSDYVPGPVVKVRFYRGSSSSGWGFRVDRVSVGEDHQLWTQTDHPTAGTNETWTIVNPDTQAMSTKVHFVYIQLVGHLTCALPFLDDSASRAL